MSTQEPSSLATRAERVREGRVRPFTETDVDGRRVPVYERNATVSLPWPTVGPPRYAVEVTLHDTGREFVCVAFAIAALQPGPARAVDSALVRNLPVGTLIREAVQQLVAEREALFRAAAEEAASTLLVTHVGADGSIVTTEEPADDAFVEGKRQAWLAAAEETRSRLSEAVGSGPGKRYPPGHLERVAEIAAAARRSREPAAAAVAEAFGISASAAQNQIGRARRLGLFDALATTDHESEGTTNG